MPKTRTPFTPKDRVRNRDDQTQHTYNEFARRLQALMQERGWNQSEMARRCKALMPKGTEFGRDRISHYIRAQVMPRPDGMKVLADALGVKESDLVPPRALPPAVGERPTFEMKSVGGDRVSLSVNRTVTMATATKIIAMLQAEDGK